MQQQQQQQQQQHQKLHWSESLRDKCSPSECLFSSSFRENSNQQIQEKLDDISHVELITNDGTSEDNNGSSAVKPAKQKGLLRKATLPLASAVNIASRRRRETLNERSSFSDEELKWLVYCKSLQAICYPYSSAIPHTFDIWSVTSPTYCYECQSLLWGLTRQGVRCSECGVKAHQRCKDLLNADCLQRAAERSLRHGSEDKSAAIRDAMQQRIDARLVSKPELFQLLADIFQINDRQHQQQLRSEQQQLITGSCNWLANVSITVISAQGLLGKDKNGTSDPYVTVQLGKHKKRTATVMRNLNPEWNQTFQFECHNFSDRIKIRVWDEDNDIKSKIRHKLTRESDDFLGQALIDVRTLCGEMDMWYNLEKRTDRSLVAGAIHLKINVSIRGEESKAPYHTQYTCLHENMFHYVCQQAERQNVQLSDLLAVADCANSWKIFFQSNLQEIIDEFAVRFGIEPIFQAMVHLSCLSCKMSNKGIALTVSQLLANINSQFAHSTKTKLSVCNFGEQRFVNVVNEVHSSITESITDYRTNYPASDEGRLKDLSSAVDLLTSILFFRMKIQKMSSVTRAADEVKVCVQQCCINDYNAIRQQQQQQQSLQDWNELIDTIASLIEDDTNHYSLSVNQFSQEFILHHVTSLTFWQEMSRDLQLFLQQQQQQQNTAVSYINLQFKIKWFHAKFIKELSSDADNFYTWFQPYVMQWLQSIDVSAIEFLHSAYSRDKDEQFKIPVNHSMFSSSVLDVFTQLTQYFQIVQQLQGPNELVNENIFDRFCCTITKVLLAYATTVQNEFSQFVYNISTACVLMNNVQQLRIELHKIYEIMSPNLHCDTQQQLQFLQQQLSDVLDDLADRFIQLQQQQQLLTAIATSVKLLKSHSKLKSSSFSSSTSSSSALSATAHTVMQPVLTCLDSTLTTCSVHCSRPVLKRVLKHMCSATLNCVLKFIVLPDSSEAGLMNLNSDIRLSAKQCLIMQAALNALRSYFYANGNGLKLHHLDKFAELQTLNEALKLYNLTTDKLIELFVTTQTAQENPSIHNSVGEISLQIDSAKHPGNGDVTLSVKVVEVVNLKWDSANMPRPYIELVLVGPHLANKKRKVATKSKNSVDLCKFNDVFKFNLGHIESANSYELHITCKDYCFTRNDSLIGVTVLQLHEILQLGGAAHWCKLGNRLHMDELGDIIVRVLALRQNDDVASEFVQLKRAGRDAQSDSV